MTNVLLDTSLETTKITHEALASTNITNLPNLGDNPLLASYLCDGASDVTTPQGENKDEKTSACENKKTTLKNILHQGLLEHFKPHQTVVSNLLAYHDVIPSEIVAGRLAYFQNDEKRAKDIRTPIKVRKYLSKFFGDSLTRSTIDSIAHQLDSCMFTTKNLDVRIYDDSQIDGWADAYYHILSCMSTQTKNYGHGRYETYRCYCTLAMTNGAKSSGLSLAVLYQDDKPVARSIVYEEGDAKYYVRNYGDDRLVRWLEDNGYRQQCWLPTNTHLWTKHFGDGDYISPYVDDDDGDAFAELTHIDGQPYWVISEDGVCLQNSDGYTCIHSLTCDGCDDYIIHGDEYDRTDLEGYDVVLCHNCVENHCYTVDGDSEVYVRHYKADKIIPTNNQGYFTREYLDNHGLVLTGDDDVVSKDKVEYCERYEKYYPKSDFTDLSNKPQFVRDTWAGYINDNNQVQTYLYYRDGMYITELDCCVHGAHARNVLTRLENKAEA